MRKLLLAALALVLFAGQALAQKTISGRVTDESGAPLPNVSVLVKGSVSGTTTKPDGSFSLSVPANATTLVFTSIGKATKEIAIGNSTSLDVFLANSATDMDEVIVVAYGSVKKADFVGSAAQINAKQLENRPLSNPLNAIVGAAPGVQTTLASGAPGSSPGIVIRGFGSLNLSNAPLYVVDGVVYDGGFSNINPDDIETISILKDAATTSLYGSRGANGVVMITTKRGKRGKQTLQVRVQSGRSNPAFPQYSTVGTGDYFELAWESYRNGIHYGPTGAPLDSASMIASGTLPRITSGSNAGRQSFRNLAFRDIYQVLGGYNPYNVGNTSIVGLDGKINPNAELLYADDLNWLDQATRTGTRNEYSVVYTSGSDKSDVSASFNYLKEGGWGLRSDMERFTGRVTANVQPTSWFKSGFNLAGNRTRFNYSATGGIVNPFYFARYIAPIYPVWLREPGTGELVLDAQGNAQYDFGNEYGYARPYNSGRHTIAEHLWNLENETRDFISARANAEITFTPWLKLTTNISFDATNTEGESYQNPIVGDGYPAGRLSLSSSKVTSYTFNQLLNFNRKFNLHNVSAVLGHENYDFKSRGLDGMRIGQSFDGVFMYSNFNTINSLTNSLNEAKVESYFSSINYDYDSKYFLSTSARRDGNSKFAPDVRWANFWSVGGAWRVDRENFFKLRWVDMLKLRASYGKVGNSGGLSNYPFQPGYSIGYDNATFPGVLLSELGSPALTWETQNPLDFGVDFSLFKGRLSGTVEYFIRKSSGLIFAVPQPYQNGGTPSGPFSIDQNVGNMRNNGIEIQLTGNLVRTRDFNWNLTVNATSYKNEIIKMPPERQTIQTGNFRWEAGKDRYEFFTRTFYGVDPADGQVLYLGVNAYNAANTRLIDKGNGQIDTVTIDHNNARFSHVGKSVIPDVYGSIINSLTYKNFELNFTLTYQLGGYIFDGVYGSLMSTTLNGNTYHVDMKNRWQQPGDITNVPRLDETRSAQYGAASTRWLTKGSYLGINNVSFAYRLPSSVISKIGAANARVFVSGENLYYFTARKGLAVGNSFAGSTGDNYNPARIVTAGISVNF